MKKQFLRNNFDFVLAHAIEECSEFISAAAKSQRWGLDSVDPTISKDQQETNEEWMRREMKDVRLALARLELALDGNLA